MVIMNTDDEVKEALRHRKGDIFRIYPRLVGTEYRKTSQRRSRSVSVESIKQPELATSVAEIVITEKEPINVFIGADFPMEQETLREPEKATEEKGKCHGSVICDCCNQQGIRGIRYKCLICADYDLCATCEGKRLHDEHPMIRIANPGDRSWMPAFMATQGMQGMNGGHFRRHGPCSFMNRGGRGFHRGHHADGGHRTEESNQGQQQSEQQRAAPENAGANFLRDVGQAVAAVLNGFGIDVDLDVEHDGQRTKIATPKSAEKKEEKVDEKKPEPTIQKSEEIATATPTSPPAAEQMDTTANANVNDHPQDWMILDSNEAAAMETVAPILPPRRIVVAPNIETPTAAAAASIPADMSMTNDPRVAAALKYMLSMGFTNEGGWLTQLLEAKNGDITAVLDILHPSSSQ
jgi:sequestosome 1